MRKLLRGIGASKAGASAAEYALMLAIVSGSVVTALVGLRDHIGSALTSIAGQMIGG